MQELFNTNLLLILGPLSKIPVGLLAEFDSVVDAVRCAVDIQRGMTERNATAPPDDRIEFRIGINVGDIIKDGGDIFGDAVNVSVVSRLSPTLEVFVSPMMLIDMCWISSISPLMMAANKG